MFLMSLTRDLRNKYGSRFKFLLSQAFCQKYTQTHAHTCLHTHVHFLGYFLVAMSLCFSCYSEASLVQILSADPAKREIFEF